MRRGMIIQYIIRENATAYRTEKKLCIFGHVEWQYLKKIEENHQTIYVGNPHLTLQADRKSIESHRIIQYSITAIQFNTFQGIVNTTV